MLDGDVAQTLGAILREELNVTSEILVIDGVMLMDFDYIDLGRIRMPSNTVPVTIKSLVFSEDPRGPRPRQRLHHHAQGHEHPHEHGTDISTITGTIIAGTFITNTVTNTIITSSVRSRFGALRKCASRGACVFW